MTKTEEELFDKLEEFYYCVRGLIKIPKETDNIKEGVVRLDFNDGYCGRKSIYLRYELLFRLLLELEEIEDGKVNKKNKH